MDARSTPHFHNTMGVPVIVIGSKEFMCVGALPPQDHPHVFLDMGNETEIVCPYCSTLYRRDPALPPGAASPRDAILPDAGGVEAPLPVSDVYDSPYSPRGMTNETDRA